MLAVNIDVAVVLRRVPGDDVLSPLVEPDDGVRERLASRTVEGDRRLALVCDADRGDVCRRELVALANFLEALDDVGVDLLWVMLDPAGLRRNLLVLSGGRVKHVQVPVDDEYAAGGGALVNREDALATQIFFHRR